MKKILLAGVALATLTVAGVASAADLPSRRQVAPAYIPPVFTWTGFYAGINAGYAFNGDNDLKDVFVNGISLGNLNAPRDNSDSGSFTGGAQIGYNYQMGSVVFGLEADINYANLSRRSSWNFVDTNEVVTGRSKVEWFGTVRPRLGFTPVDRLLVFVTGGLAYGQVKTNGSYNFAGFNVVGGSNDDTRVGWTVGAGVEYAITNNLTVKGEYAYVDLGDKRHTWTDALSGDTISFRDETNFHIVRAGLNYKF